MGRLQRGFSSEAGWTEEELIEYTLMLSRNTNGNGHGNRNEEWEPDPEPDWPSSVESGAGSFGGRSWNGNAGRHRTSIGSGHSPSLRPGNSPRVSARTREEVEDEELQFVLQLSLVDK